MRDLFQRSDLARYAGQFVWLELNYDEPQNTAFFTKYGVRATPTFVMIDPRHEDVLELKNGAMSLQEITQFLERGASRLVETKQIAADQALKRADILIVTSPKEAIAAYQQALQLAPPGWNDRELAETLLIIAFQHDRQPQQCAEMAAADAPHMTRSSNFARTVMTGLWCIADGGSADWTPSAFNRLKPLAEEALSLSTTVRDHRNEIYRALMLIAVSRKDSESAGRWGNRWLDELDTIKPTSDDERSALDIARVENVQVYGDANRIIPALIESERAMPNNYVASLRLAQAELMANRYADAIGTINRGLARNPGAVGRSWLLEMKAEVLTHNGEPDEARKALQSALVAAQQIPTPESRKRTVDRIRLALDAMTKSPIQKQR